MKRWGAIILAAGKGERYGGAKQNEYIYGSTLIEWAVRRTRPHVDWLVLVLNREEGEKRVIPRYGFADEICFGGERRYDSMAAGLELLETDYVLVVDASRCNTHRDVYHGVKSAVETGFVGACPLVPTVETVIFNRDPLDREKTFLCQTPEAYEAAALRAFVSAAENHSDLKKHDFLFMFGMIRAGAVAEDFVFVQGDRRNLKVTYREDVDTIRALWVPWMRPGGGEPAEEPVGLLPDPPPFAQ